MEETTDSSFATDEEEPNFKEQPQEHLRSYNGSEDGGATSGASQELQWFRRRREGVQSD